MIPRSLLVALLSLACLVCPSVAFTNTPYDPVFARHMLDIAGATYCHSDQIQSWSCAFCKEEASFLLTGSYENVTSNMQVLAGFDPTSQNVVLAFKGTSPTSIVNWLQDLTYEFLDEECPNCAVHAGFYDTYLSVRPQAISLLKRAMAANPGAPFTITGHSLGGALTNIAAVDLAVTEELVASTVFTFGQPRTGNKDYVAYFTETFNNSTVWRVTHGADPVPHVPTLDMGYIHNAYEVYYDVLNTAWHQCDPSGEDPECADRWLVALDPLAHGAYLSGDFLARFLECQLYAEAQGTPLKEVVEPARANVQQPASISFGASTQPEAEAAAEQEQRPTEPTLPLPNTNAIAFA